MRSVEVQLDVRLLDPDVALPDALVALDLKGRRALLDVLGLLIEDGGLEVPDDSQLPGVAPLAVADLPELLLQVADDLRVEAPGVEVRQLDKVAREALEHDGHVVVNQLADLDTRVNHRDHFVGLALLEVELEGHVGRLELQQVLRALDGHRSVQPVRLDVVEDRHLGFHDRLEKRLVVAHRKFVEGQQQFGLQVPDRLEHVDYQSDYQVDPRHAAQH